MAVIKNSVYIRNLKPAHKAILKRVADDYGLATGIAALEKLLDLFADSQKEIDRLNRMIEYKQNKIKKLEDRIDMYIYYAGKKK